ncbi:P-loop containing nucleoside triphosphate hydrolase protein, partial [Paraphysoderma sedebokerense]
MAFWKPGTVAPGSNVLRPVGLRATTAEEDDLVIATFNAYSSEASGLPLSQQRLRLPIYKHRNQILYLVENHPVTVIIGQTGSGKTTQIPQYLHEVGWSEGGRTVVCTQPRRVAATSIASRVAEERSCQLGEEVGYSIRFDDKSSADTRIKYTTDGTLFRETLSDPLLSKYSVIMIDEAHERSVYTDLLLGLIKKIMRKRPDLRLIVASATLDAEKFAQYFKDVKGYDGKEPVTLMTLEGRMFPVDIHYQIEPCQDYVEEAINVAATIHEREDAGDILVFLTGREEIDKVVSGLKNRQRSLNSPFKLLALPLYAGMSSEQQMKIFEPTPRGTRKVVVATNIAEASITIEGIVYVIDCGFVKIRTYNPITNLSTLVVTPASQSSATQRAGNVL